MRNVLRRVARLRSRCRRLALIAASLIVFFGLGAAASSADDVRQARKVFARYLVAYPTYGTDVESFARELAEARALGIDGFVVNVAGWSREPFYHGRVENLFAAARRFDPPFALFLSADMCCGLSSDDIRTLLRRYGRHRSYFYHEGRPVLTTFQGERLGAAFWRRTLHELQNDELRPFFIPNFFVASGCDFNDPSCGDFNTPGQERIASSVGGWWNEVIDGLHYSAVAGTAEALVASGEAYARALRERQKMFVAGVCPYFWEGRLSAIQPRLLRRYYEMQGGEGIEKQWLSIIDNQKPRWVIIDTWNDFNESYLTVADAREMKLKKHFYNAGPLLLTHAGYAEYFKYYIRWFKEGRREITADTLFFFYRTHPKDAVASDDVHNLVLYGPVEDVIYLTTMLRSQATVRVTSGGRTTSHAVPAGLAHLRVPFLPGPQTFEVLVDGRAILRAEGEAIDAQIGKFNFTTTAGFASNLQPQGSR